MGRPVRVRNPLFDVLEVLLQAFDSRADDLHGWAIMKATKRSGPTVYGVLDRLEDTGWIFDHWEYLLPGDGPRRRFYAMTSTGREHYAAALQAHRERRAAWLRPVTRAGSAGARSGARSDP